MYVREGWGQMYGWEGWVRESRGQMYGWEGWVRESRGQMYGWEGWVRESRGQMSHTHTGQWYRSSMNHFPLCSVFWVEVSLVIWYSRHPHKILWSYLLQLAAYTLHMDMSLSSMPPTQCTWSCFLLVCQPGNYCRIFRHPVSFRYQVNFQLFSFTVFDFLLICHSCNLCSTSTGDTCILFTLGTRCIFCYFHSQCLTSSTASTFLRVC